MPVYVVSYDLKVSQGTHDYSDLDKAFNKLESHKVLYSVYLVSSPWRADQLKDYLMQHMDDGDRIWVSRMPTVSNRDYAYAAMKGTNAWVEAHPPS